jgi:hypothetical protein
LAQAACRDGVTVVYKRMPRLPPVSGKLSAALFFSNFQVGGLGQ